MPTPVLPDVEALLGSFLRNHPELTPIHQGRVATRLSGTYPAIRVSLIAVRPTQILGEYLPELQVECFADDQGVASLLARKASAAMADVIGAYPEGAVRGHDLVFGPFWSPDATTQRPRYLFDVLLLAYPNP